MDTLEILSARRATEIASSAQDCEVCTLTVAIERDHRDYHEGALQFCDHVPCRLADGAGCTGDCHCP